jgi:hypothetical protein
VGTSVSCRTCLDKEIEGEVLAFDSTTRMLIIKSYPTLGGTSQNNVHMLNMGFVADIQVIRECKDKPAEPASLKIERLNSRAKEQIDKKKKLTMAMKAGVSPEGQRLLTAIDKTIDEVHWSGEDECDPGGLFEAITAVPASDDRQNVKAAQVRDDAQDGARDEQDKNTLFEAVTQVKTVDDCPARPKRSSMPTPRCSTDDYSLEDYKPDDYGPYDTDTHCVKSKPRTRTRGSGARARGSM